MSHVLHTILDHPKIDMSYDEYRRIRDSFKLYRNKHNLVEYKNSYGVIKTREYMALNMMEKSSKYLAKLLFNEKCEISIGNETASEFIAKVFEDNDFYRNFSRYLEPMLALGGLVVVPYFDDQYRIKLSWGLPHCFYPLHSNTGEISSGALVTETEIKEGHVTAYYTLIAFHEWDEQEYTIYHELYRSEEPHIVGVRVPLNRVYDSLIEWTVVPSLEKGLFNYVKPAGFNNLNPSSPLGLGICDNAKSTLKQINDVYDAFNWEIKAGERKIAVPEFMTRAVPGLKGEMKQTLDESTNVFLGMPLGTEQPKPIDLTSDIRSRQYIESINKFLQTLEMQLEFSPGTFTFDGKSVKTATEVVSENSLTYRTRNTHAIEIEIFLKDLIISILSLASLVKTDKGYLYQGAIPKHNEIGIDFDDGVFQSKDALLDHYAKAFTLGLMPNTIAMQKAFNITEDEALKWYQMMKEENKLDMPVPPGGVEF